MVYIVTITAKKVTEDGYIDDNLSGGSEEEMIMETTLVEGKFSYQIQAPGVGKSLSCVPRSE
jgi:hypothetical protein